MNKNNLKPYILLSILPLVYLANTLETALFMGLVYLLVAVVIYFAGMVIDEFSEGRMRMYTYIVLAAMIITVMMTILNTYFTLNQFMGIYLALILFTIPQLKSEAIDKQKTFDHIFMMLVGFVVLVLIGLLREFLGTGSITLLAFGMDTVQIFNADFGISILKEGSGGFILAGFIFAALNGITFVKEDANDAV